MKPLLIFMACMLLDAIVPACCQSEEYRMHRFDRWNTNDYETTRIDSANADSANADSAATSDEADR